LLRDFDLKKAIEEPLEFTAKSSQIKFKDRNCFQRIIRIIYLFLRLIYTAGYFYFMPLLVVIITYVLAPNNNAVYRQCFHLHS